MATISRTAQPEVHRASREKKWTVAMLIAWAMLQIGSHAAPATLQIVNVRALPAESATQFEKFELTFEIAGSAASDMQWPYDAAPPKGIPVGTGITVNAVFNDPSGVQYLQPAFYTEVFLDEIRDGRDWHLPTGIFVWRVRFTPHRPGVWTYKIVASDRSGATETSANSFSVAPSTKRGFVRVSPTDSRYFEFDDGTLFAGRGFQLPAFMDNPTTKGAPEYEKLASHGIDFVRVWINSIFGSAWNSWIGGRNQYAGYLPTTGLTPLVDTTSGQTVLTMRLDYESEGDAGWFDACRMQLWWEDRAESIKPNATYRIQVRYSGSGITGPRRSAHTNFGLVAKLDGWHPDCHEPGTSTAVTRYGGNTTGVSLIEGSWFSGSNNFLPRMYLALENVREGTVWIHSVSLREDLGGGRLGPELMVESSMERHLYIPHEKAHSLDKIVTIAERTGVFLKLVVMEKNDKVYMKLADDGSWVNGEDNQGGFYGLGRGMNKTRWLQQVWWRYLQARWGYSPAIHSWELINEGDPGLTAHYEMADEFGKFMRCRVFGVEPGAGDGAGCALRHPNAHLVTTSFWHSFPAAQFWKNSRYPNIDYADVHAYVSTSYAPLPERQRMQTDAAYYHIWHSADVARWRAGKPVVRGEAGLDTTDAQSDTGLGLRRDTAGVWLHNYLWSTLHSGGMYELYWWDTHISGEGFDHRPIYRALRNFFADVPLNKGGYVDWGGSVTHSSLRVVGQKNPGIGALHLWVQNQQHTWKNVVDGTTIPGVSGEIVVPGFRSGTTYSVQRWNTHTMGGNIEAVLSIVADPAGNLNIPVTSLLRDVAFKITGMAGSAPSRPTNVRIVG